MKTFKVLIFICVAYWITRFYGLNYFVDYVSLDYIFVGLTGVSIIGLLWSKLEKNSLILLFFFVPAVLINWLFSHDYRPVHKINEPVKYFVNENKDIEVKGQDFNIRNSPDYISTYKIYKKVIGPIYFKEKVFRERSDSMGDADSIERALKD